MCFNLARISRKNTASLCELGDEYRPRLDCSGPSFPVRPLCVSAWRGGTTPWQSSSSSNGIPVRSQINTAFSRSLNLPIFRELFTNAHVRPKLALGKFRGERLLWKSKEGRIAAGYKIILLNYPHWNSLVTKSAKRDEARKVVEYPYLTCYPRKSAMAMIMSRLNIDTRLKLATVWSNIIIFGWTSRIF